MKRFPLRFAALALTLVAPKIAFSQVLPLDFTGGNGTSLVDQYIGKSGSGWTTAWSMAGGADTTPSAAVTNASPIYTGGDNYLHLTYDTASGTSRSVRASRQWDTSGSALSLTSPVTLSFYFRSDTAIQSANQNILIFGSSNAAASTGSNDSWKLTIDGGGIAVFDGTTTVSLATAANAGTNVANTPFKMTFNVNPTADTYTVTVTRLDTNVSFVSGTLALRNGSDASLSYFNFVSNGAASKTGLGFSLDGVSVVPEPTSLALVTAGVALVGVIRRRRIQS